MAFVDRAYAAEYHRMSNDTMRAHDARDESRPNRALILDDQWPDTRRAVG